MNSHAQYHDNSTDDIEHTLSILGIHVRDDATTNPVKMTELFKKLNLDIESLDQNSESVLLLKRLITDKISLKPLKQTFFLGIKHNPPIYNTLLDIANSSMKTKYVLSDDQQTQLDDAIYFIIILQVLTQLMVNDKEFEFAIVKLIMNKRGALNPASTFWNFIRTFIVANRNFFLALKLVSVDPFMMSTICLRHFCPYPTNEELNQIIKDYKITGLNAIVLQKEAKLIQLKERNYGGLCGNILEALMSEKSHAAKGSSIDNVKAGLALILHLEQYKNDYPPMEFTQHFFDLYDANEINDVSKDDSFWHAIFNYHKKDNINRQNPILTEPWVNLYEAWNLAFVLRSFPESYHILIPKLLIPATLYCIPEYYMSSRLVSLWLTLNFASMLRTQNYKIDYPPIQIDEWLTLFGKHNLAYAKDVVLKELAGRLDLEQQFKERISDRSTFLNYIEAIRLIMS